VVDDPAVLSALTPAQKAFAAFARALQSKQTAIVAKEIFSAEEIAALKAAVAPSIKAGKVLSSANEKILRAAHDAIIKACTTIKEMVDAQVVEPDSTDDAGAKALRARRAKALKHAATKHIEEPKAA
jgi:hypothetical protein